MDKRIRNRKIYYKNNREKVLESSHRYRREHTQKISEDRKALRKSREKKLLVKECKTCGISFETKSAVKLNCDEHTYRYSGRNKDYSRNYNLIRSFGITLEKYEEILKSQNDCCAICSKHRSSFKKNMAVDHNHKTREIRGILCTNCNHRIIGRHNDPSVFRKAADYLDNHTGLFVPEKLKKVRKKRKLV